MTTIELTDTTPRHYELPTGITYASLVRGREDIYRQIFTKYCPVVPLETLTESKRIELGYQDMPLDEGPVHKECAEAKEARAMAIETQRAEDQNFINAGEPVPDDRAELPEPRAFCPHQGAPTEVPDPDVLYVGRIIDGLTWLRVFESRKLAKNLINNIPASQTFTRRGISGMFTGGGEVSWSFSPAKPRAEMYKSLGKGAFSAGTERVIRDGIGPTINMGTIIKNAEPGEILNSPTTVTPKQVGEGEVDMWEAGEAEFKFEPKIRLDNRYGMHYLKRGDEINIISLGGWPKPRTPAFNHTWSLIPPSEGPSYVKRDEGGNDEIYLSGLRA